MKWLVTIDGRGGRRSGSGFGHRGLWEIETGTPTFLVDLLTTRGNFPPDLAGVRASEALLSTFDVDSMSAEALLWQSG